MRRVLAIFVLLIGLGLGAFLATRLALDKTPASELAPESDPALAALPTVSPADIEEFRQEAERQSREDLQKPRFQGALDAFVVVQPGQARQQAPCEAVRSRSRDFEPSELNLPGMGEQAICQDGTVVGVCSDGLGCRQYFFGVPQVVANAPRDRLETFELDGRPALAVRPIPDFREWTIYVIQRAPSASKPGILLQVIASEGGFQKAVDTARSLMVQ